MPVPQALAQGIAQQSVVPFVGSGLSLSVRRGLFPTWPGLLHRMAERLEREDKPKQGQIVKLFSELGKLYGVGGTRPRPLLR